ncbi:MAG: hypothetical protein KQ78_02234 [Candidatus Izimaplasma bacterium HR2]|nr:MAG: hypothetical protein KQ78_02234 [Candidatus Izimaplasma bacterium HR2]
MNGEYLYLTDEELEIYRNMNIIDLTEEEIIIEKYGNRNQIKKSKKVYIIRNGEIYEQSN